MCLSCGHTGNWDGDGDARCVVAFIDCVVLISAIRQQIEDGDDADCLVGACHCDMVLSKTEAPPVTGLPWRVHRFGLGAHGGRHVGFCPVGPSRGHFVRARCPVVSGREWPVMNSL